MRIKQTVQNLGIWAATEIHDDSTQKLAIVKESSTLFMRLAGAEEELQKGRKKGKLQSVAYDQTRKLKQKLND
jgi:glucose-6-phosphate-specific signal transduction histidine kinase